MGNPQPSPQRAREALPPSGHGGGRGGGAADAVQRLDVGGGVVYSLLFRRIEELLSTPWNTKHGGSCVHASHATVGSSLN